ncbi:MAG: nucleotidyltransferase domain-containing protein [Patescibacteria group bacterium]
MISVQKITEELIRKYDPIAVYLSGSRARGRERPDSDYDFHLVVPNFTHPISEKILGQSVDIKSIFFSDLPNSIIDTVYSPAIPYQPIYKDVKFLKDLNNLEERTKNAYEVGPAEWSKQEYTENKNRTLRFLEAIEGTTHVPIISFRHFCKFFDLSLLCWFGIRKRWSVPIYEALDIFSKEDPEFYEIICSMESSSSAKERSALARKLYTTLFR